MSAPRLVLKQPTGWFAAGCEVAQALALLSDAGFKLYLYLCLQADRHNGRLILNCAEVTKALGKGPAWIEDGLGELCRNQVCERCVLGRIEICDRFWPYRKLPGVAATEPEAKFVREVRTAFLQPACVRSSFSVADEKLALNLFWREVSLEQVRWAIWVGCARKYMAMLNGQTRQPITSLAYFEPLLAEVKQPQIPTSYWEHVRRRMEQMEKRWLRTANSGSAAGKGAEPLPPEML
jgi:hypothetical protein